jgi:hypothetical protein
VPFFSSTVQLAFKNRFRMFGSLVDDALLGGLEKVVGFSRQYQGGCCDLSVGERRASVPEGTRSCSRDQYSMAGPTHAKPTLLLIIPRLLI